MKRNFLNNAGLLILGLIILGYTTRCPGWAMAGDKTAEQRR